SVLLPTPPFWLANSMIIVKLVYLEFFLPVVLFFLLSLPWIASSSISSLMLREACRLAGLCILSAGYCLVMDISSDGESRRSWLESIAVCLSLPSLGTSICGTFHNKANLLYSWFFR